MLVFNGEFKALIARARDYNDTRLIPATTSDAGTSYYKLPRRFNLRSFVSTRKMRGLGLGINFLLPVEVIIAFYAEILVTVLKVMVNYCYTSRISYTSRICYTIDTEVILRARMDRKDEITVILLVVFVFEEMCSF